MKLRAKSRVHSITWTCPRCDKVFTTQFDYAVHRMQCGS